jgi:hypothetical protein
MSYDLNEGAKHLVHDYAWLCAAGYDCTRGDKHLSGRSNHYGERTFLVHCRAVSDFFGPPKTDRKGKLLDRDMFACDFMDSPSDPQLKKWEEWHDHMDKHLMHLSRSRITNTNPWAGQDKREMLEGFKATWREFYAKLKPSVKPAFDTALETFRQEFGDVPLD